MGIRHFVYRFKYRYGQHLPLKSPVDVSLELASQCNMKCNYCYHSDSNKEFLPFTPGVMKKETAIIIIDEACDLGVNSLKMNWKGESTINPHFRDITKYAHDLASGSTFIERLTNSNFKFRTDREDIFEGLNYQTKVKVSYDSFVKEVFETQRAGGDHDLTTRNIDKFYHWPNRKTELVIQAVRTKLNKNEDIEAEVKRRWPSAEVSIRDMVGGRTTSNLGQFEDRKRDDSQRQSCLQAHVRLIFNWKGDGIPCCPDIGETLKLGNIHKKSMKDIFNSAFAQNLREDLKDCSAFQKYETCKNCSSFETYKGFKPAWNS